MILLPCTFLMAYKRIETWSIRSLWARSWFLQNLKLSAEELEVTIVSTLQASYQWRKKFPKSFWKLGTCTIWRSTSICFSERDFTDVLAGLDVALLLTALRKWESIELLMAAGSCFLYNAHCSHDGPTRMTKTAFLNPPRIFMNKWHQRGMQKPYLFPGNTEFTMAPSWVSDFFRVEIAHAEITSDLLLILN